MTCFSLVKTIGNLPCDMYRGIVCSQQSCSLSHKHEPFKPDFAVKLQGEAMASRQSLTKTILINIACILLLINININAISAQTQPDRYDYYGPTGTNETCFYDRGYVYVNVTDTYNGTDYPNLSGLSGLYVRDTRSGIFGSEEKLNLLQGSGCGLFAAGVYEGTYLYRPLKKFYDGSKNRNVYLYFYYKTQSGNQNNYRSLIFGESICAGPGSSAFMRSSFNVDVLDCDWAEMDSDTNITNVTWLTGNGRREIDYVSISDETEGCYTPQPTMQPTLSPVPTYQLPSFSPTTAFPTVSPTDPTDAPSADPSKAPTVKPTKLPTPFVREYLDPPCPAMLVTNLQVIFPGQVEAEGMNIYIRHCSIYHAKSHTT